MGQTGRRGASNAAAASRTSRCRSSRMQHLVNESFLNHLRYGFVRPAARTVADYLNRLFSTGFGGRVGKTLALCKRVSGRPKPKPLIRIIRISRYVVLAKRKKFILLLRIYGIPHDTPGGSNVRVRVGSVVARRCVKAWARLWLECA